MSNETKERQCEDAISQLGMDDECVNASVKLVMGPVITSPHGLKLFKIQGIHMLTLVPKYPSYTKCATTSHHLIFLRAEM